MRFEKLERMSSGPWEYLFDQGGHWIVSGRTRKVLAVFEKEKDAIGVAEILLDLPGLLDEHAASHSAEDYDAVIKENDEMEKEFARLEGLLEDRNERKDKLLEVLDALKESTYDLGVLLEGEGLREDHDERKDGLLDVLEALKESTYDLGVLLEGEAAQKKHTKEEINAATGPELDNIYPKVPRLSKEEDGSYRIRLLRTVVQVTG